ncbi:MAG: DUF2914 domain-containing protein [Parahaliea sp.]
MTDSSNKLTVRVQLPRLNDTQATDAAARAPQYQGYRWDRIAVAALVLVVVTGLLVRLLADGEAPATTPGQAPRPALFAPAQLDVDVAQRAAGDTVDAPAVALVAVPGHGAETGGDLAPATAEVTTEAAEVAAPPEQLADAVPAVTEAVVEAASSSAATTVATAPVLQGAKPDQASSQEVSSPRPASQQQISKHIARFSLAAGMQGLEPVGDLATLRPDDKGAVRVYAFADVRQMAGAFVQFVWLLDGKQMAGVRMGIGSDRYRIHASKLITATMRGQWRVELRQRGGELLAFAEFEY